MQQPIITKPINFQDPVTLQQSILQLGIKKSLYPWYKQLILGWYSGFYLGIIYTVAVRCSGNNEFLAQNKGLQKYVVASIIPLTLMIIIVNGYELITGNMAVYIPGLLSGKIPIPRLLKAWGLVYLGNFAGSLNATGLFVYVSKIFDGTPWEEMVIKAAEEKMNTD